MSETIQITQPKLQPLSLSEIRESATNPRRTFDPVKLKELAESIATQGLFSPLIVRVNPNEDSKYELVAGARRYRASRYAGLSMVPCIVHKDMSDRDALEIQLAENAQREDVAPMEEAEGYQRLIKEFGYTHKSLADRVGKSAQHIANRVKLVHLCPAARKALDRNIITISHANLIARHTPEQQQKLLEYVVDGDLEAGDEDDGNYYVVSVSELSKHIEQRVYTQLSNAPFPLASDPNCGTCEKNSEAQTDLFAELAGTAYCTDRDCYQQKLDKHTNQQLVNIRNADPKALVISSSWRGNRDVQALPSHMYKSADGNDPNAIEALAIDGDSQGRTVYVIPSEDAKKWLEEATQQSKPKHGTSEPEDEAKAEREEAQKRKEKAAFRTRLRKLVVAEIAKYEAGPITLDRLRLVSPLFFRLKHSPEWRDAFAMLMGKPQAIFKAGLPPAFEKSLKSPEDYLWAALAELLAEVEVHEWHNSDLNEAQAAVARELNIDLNALAKQARTESTPDRKATGEAKPSKKPTKGKASKK